MKFAIIAAGEGSRLRAEGVEILKPLVRINGIPLIDRILAAAVRNGAESIHCIINEQSPQLHDYLEQKDLGIPLNILVRSTPSSMHSLFALAPMLRDEQFCLSTVDAVFLDQEFGRFLSYAVQRSNIDGILAVTRFIDDEKPLCAIMGRSNRILSFSNDSDGTLSATGGLYVFSPRIFDEMQNALDAGVTRLRNFLRLLLEKGHMLQGFPFQKIIDVDHSHDIKTAKQFLQEHMNESL